MVKKVKKTKSVISASAASKKTIKKGKQKKEEKPTGILDLKHLSLSDKKIPKPKKGKKEVSTDKASGSHNQEITYYDETSTLDVLYCLCKKNCEGTMIKCDNDVCPREWFHLACVSLKSAPEGAWYCPKCCDGTSEKSKSKQQLQVQLKEYNEEMESGS